VKLSLDLCDSGFPSILSPWLQHRIHYFNTQCPTLHHTTPRHATQKTVKVCNKSEIPVRFEWKAFATPEMEEEERSSLLSELNAMQELEEQKLDSELASQMEDDQHDSDGSLSGDEGMIPPTVRAARAALSQKYRQLKHALMEDDMQFVNENYEIKVSAQSISYTSGHVAYSLILT